MGSFLQYIRLIFQIIRHGRLYPTGKDYNKARTDQLISLQEFIPTDHPLHGVKHRPNHKKPSILQFIKGQAAFVKNSLKLKGGHLTSTQLSLSYVRIPKSASTSASMALLKKKYPYLEQRSVTESQINFLVDVNLQNNIIANEKNTYFTIVRNPFARLVSVYHDFFETDTNNFIYSDYLFGILKQSLSFSDFIDHISMIPDRLKDQHLKPQHCFLTYYENIGVPIKVFKLEDQDKINQFLESFSIRLTHSNKSKSPYHYQDYYTLVTLQKVFNLYRTDIEKFGYQQEFEALLKHVKDQKTVQK